MCKDLKCGKSFSQEQSLKIHNHEIHECHKDIKCEFCVNSLSEEGTFTEFMKPEKITNINIVIIFFLKVAN